MTSAFVTFKAILLTFSQKESSFKSLLQVLLILTTEFYLKYIYHQQKKWRGQFNSIV